MIVKQGQNKKFLRLIGIDMGCIRHSETARDEQRHIVNHSHTIYTHVVSTTALLCGSIFRSRSIVREALGLTPTGLSIA